MPLANVSKERTPPTNVNGAYCNTNAIIRRLMVGGINEAITAQ